MAGVIEDQVLDAQHGGSVVALCGERKACKGRTPWIEGWELRVADGVGPYSPCRKGGNWRSNPLKPINYPGNFLD